jgi:hypothetical protein
MLVNMSHSQHTSILDHVYFRVKLVQTVMLKILESRGSFYVIDDGKYLWTAVICWFWIEQTGRPTFSHHYLFHTFFSACLHWLLASSGDYLFMLYCYQLHIIHFSPIPSFLFSILVTYHATYFPHFTGKRLGDGLLSLLLYYDFLFQDTSLVWYML